MSGPGVAVAPARRAGAVAGLLGTAGAGGAGLIAVVLRDPHLAGSWGTCPLLATTGLLCPGCGGLRAVHDLLHADVAAALSSNAAVVVVLALLAAGWAAAAVSLLRRRPLRWERWVTGRGASVLLLALLAFTLARNTPLAAGLAP